MRWRSRARYAAYSAGGPPPPGETPPGAAPGVATASPWPGRATTPAPPSPPLAVVVDSSARPECPAPTGDAPGEAAVSGSGFCDTAALADVGVSTETGALGAIAEGTAFVGAALSGTRSTVVASRGREISGASGGATARAGAESPPLARDAPGDDAGARFARVPDRFRPARDPTAGFVGPFASVASVVRSMNSPGSEVRQIGRAHVC